MGELVVAELGSVRELLVHGVLYDNREGMVVMEGRADVKPVLAVEVQKSALAGLGMNEDAVAA